MIMHSTELNVLPLQHMLMHSTELQAKFTQALATVLQTLKITGMWMSYSALINNPASFNLTIVSGQPGCTTWQVHWDIISLAHDIPCQTLSILNSQFPPWETLYHAC